MWPLSWVIGVLAHVQSWSGAPRVHGRGPGMAMATAPGQERAIAKGHRDGRTRITAVQMHSDDVGPGRRSGPCPRRVLCARVRAGCWVCLSPLLPEGGGRTPPTQVFLHSVNEARQARGAGALWHCPEATPKLELARPSSSTTR